MAPKTKFEPATDIPDLAGKVIIVTGGNAGLGAASVAAIAAHGPARIFLTARRRTAAEDFVKTLTNVPSATQIIIVDMDLSSFDSVIAAAKQISAETSRIDVLMLNAGVACVAPTLTKDGYEIQFGTNHMGHALFAQLLMPTVLETASQPTTADVRIIVIASESHRMQGFKSGIEFDKLRTDMAKEAKALAGYGGMNVYGQSKLANVLFVRSLAQKYPQIKSVAIHPGGVNTPIMGKATASNWLARKIVPVLASAFFLTVEDGVKNQLWASFGPTENVGSGEYYEPIAKTGLDSALSKDKALAERLWEYTDRELLSHGAPGWPKA